MAKPTKVGCLIYLIVSLTPDAEKLKGLAHAGSRLALKQVFIGHFSGILQALGGLGKT